MHDRFGEGHPGVIFVYFLSVIILALITLHPVYQIICLGGALGYALFLKGQGDFKGGLRFWMGTAFFIVLLNPLFIHEGETILFKMPGFGVPITLESLAFGLSSGALFLSVLLWFQSYHQQMTSDRLLYLFGYKLPQFSLLFSMVLRWIPLYQHQIHAIRMGQKCLGKDVDAKGFKQKRNHAFNIFSVFATKALENSIETANAMAARGYGLRGRTSFWIYKKNRRDGLAVIFILCLDMILIQGMLRGKMEFNHYPTISSIHWGIEEMIYFLCSIFLCFFPLFLNIGYKIYFKFKKREISTL